MRDTERFIYALRLIAPGTPLREGLENILRAKTGGLIVIGDSPQIRELAEGGFAINTDFSPAALYELAKMDGAIILSPDVKTILRANVHLMPQAAIPSQETGIRHRIAERMARQTGAIVIAISQRRSVITLYQGNLKHVVRESEVILAKANQAIQALEKYRSVMDKTLTKLSILEFEDVVNVYDVVNALQRVEMVKKIGHEIDLFIYQLGSEGRLVSMQLEELMAGVEEEGILLLRDYYVPQGERTVEQIEKTLGQYAAEENLDLQGISRLLGYGGTLSSLDLSVTPRGYRLLHKLPRLPLDVIENLVEVFGSLPRIMKAGLEELDDVDGIGEVRARNIKEGLNKLREHMLLEPHV